MRMRLTVRLVAASALGASMFGFLAAHDAAPSMRVALGAEKTEFSHGDPTAAEQYFLELMNRARRDPVAEAQRVFNDYGDPHITQVVNFFISQRPGVEFTRKQNKDAFEGYAAQPPFAFNVQLLAASRGHTAQMKAADLQSHQLPGEMAFGARITATGYVFTSAGESVFATAQSMLDAHAGFAIDYGQATVGGVPQTGHRNSLMNADGNANFVEVGVGVLTDSSPATAVGPNLITIDFARPANGVRYVTGVCYQDQNDNGFYDQGEGLAGVRVEASVGTFFTTSSASGGYALPVPANSGAIVVSVLGGTGTPGEIVGAQQFDLVMGPENVKLDVGVGAEPPPPSYARVVAAGGDASGVAADFGIAVTGTDVVPVDSLDATIADVEVEVDISHSDPRRLTLSVTSPNGTTVPLFADGLGTGGGVRGRFGATLPAEGDLGAFVGESYVGTWTLHVVNSDLPASPVTATLNGWALRIRPTWFRPLHADPSRLVLTRFAAIDSAVAGGDRITVIATLDGGDHVLDRDAPVLLRLRANDTNQTEIARFDLATATALKPTYFKTSRGTLKAKLAGLDLASLPSPLVVEVAMGGVVARQVISLVDGNFRATTTRPAATTFFVDRVKSALVGAERKTTVVGRLLTPLSLTDQAPPTGLIEIIVGNAVVKTTGEALIRRGSVWSVASKTSPLRKFVINATTGAFSARIQSTHDVLGTDGTVEVGLRIGGVYYRAEVLPLTADTSVNY